jgi:hypothetical protein
MISTSDDNYRDIAAALMEAIGTAEFFNGTISCCTGCYDARLCVTLIIRRAPALDPAVRPGAAPQIVDIIPVWWECRFYSIDGEVFSDFSWRELKNFLL